MRIEIVGTVGGYVVRIDGGPKGIEFRSEIELGKYLPGLGFSDEHIAGAIHMLNSRSGINRRISLSVRP